MFLRGWGSVIVAGDGGILFVRVCGPVTVAGEGGIVFLRVWGVCGSGVVCCLLKADRAPLIIGVFGLVGDCIFLSDVIL